MDKIKEIGVRIKEARKAKGLSQMEFASMLQISTSHLSDIENGKTKYGLDIFIRITEELQVSADWLLQTNIPEVQKIHNNELNELLSDCTSSEVQSILKMVSEMKSALHSNK